MRSADTSTDEWLAHCSADGAGQWVFARRGDAGAWAAAEGPPHWFRRAQGGDWTLDLPAMSAAPIWASFDAHGRARALGSDAAALAALVEGEWRPASLFEDVVLGFRLDGHPPFTGVQAISGLDPVRVSSDGRVDRLRPEGAPGDPEGALQRLCERVADAFRGGAALELTGGVDSRLLVALGIAGGCGPQHAFTIGGDDDPDVRVARLIAERFEIDHRVVQSHCMCDGLCAEGVEFVRRSGFALNFALYAWLPEALAALESWRDAQVSGVGGEIAEGFYYTELDWVFGAVRSLPLWMRTRAGADLCRWRRLFTPPAKRTMWRGLTGALRQEGEGLRWRAMTDWYYLRHRMVGGGLPVLRASSHWYTTIAPYFDDAYRAWSSSLTEPERANRAAQRRLIARLCPSLGEMGYAHGGAEGGRRRVLAGARRRAGRLAKAMSGASIASNPRGVETMRRVRENEAFMDRIRSFVARHTDVLDEAYCVKLLKGACERSSFALGALATHALAEEALMLERATRAGAVSAPAQKWCETR